MALMFESLFIDVFVCFLGIALGIIIYYKHAFNYWKKRKLPEVKEPTFPFGTTPIPLRDYIGNHVKHLYDAGKIKGHKHIGGFLCSIPFYIPINRECIKNILQRDFNYFTERGFYYNEKDDPLSANLFALGGEQWRILRSKLSPAFTSGKLKVMFDDLVQCGYQMQDAIEQLCNNEGIINIKDISECFTVDVIGSCAFGLECNSFKYPEAEFRKQGKKVFFISFLRSLKIAFAFSYMKLAQLLGIRLFDKETNEFFINVVKDSLKFRESNKMVRKNFLQLLLDLSNENIENHETNAKLSVEQLTAQVFIFFAAGFETSSITLTYCLYELATNVDIQDKVREEINRISRNYKGNITYDAIMDMKYLNQVVDETLRKYPPVSFITRVAVKDYLVPDTDVVIEQEIAAVIPILGLHHDPEYYPDPAKFDPERFSDENKQRRLPFTYLPFGEGPRICIGLRFGLMQVKVGLVVLLKHFRFSLSSKTQVPLEMEPYSFTLTPKSGVFLDVEKVC